MSATEAAPLVVRDPISISAKPGIRLCIVSFEVNGPCRNGGIGTAYTTLAEKLATAGHDVTLLHVRGPYSEQGKIGRWVAHFQQRGVRLVPLPGGDVPLNGSGFRHLSYLIYQWLARQECFDLVHFHEWLGLGYFSLMARRHGIAFADTRFCIGLHSPSRWIQEANQLPLDPATEENDAHERRCTELADVVWSPSQYLLDWVIDRGWRLTQPCHIHPNPLPFEPKQFSLEPMPVRELVFFGRLEVRKGLLLFCDALDRLQREDLPVGFAVTFLGKPTDIQGTLADVMIKRRAKAWPFPVHLRTTCNHEQGLRYLQGTGRLVVMPSLTENCPLTVIECLGLGVPFLASAVGGIPELVSQECHATNLVTPSVNELIERLRLSLREGVAPARAAHEGSRIDRIWDEWHRQFRQGDGRADQPPIAESDDLLNLIRGQELRIEWLEEQLRAYSGGTTKYLRYRVADAVCGWVDRVPLVRTALRRLLGFVTR